MAFSHPLAFLLGLEGVALLRAGVDAGFDAAFVQERFTEIERLLGPDGPRTADGRPMGATTTRTCYDALAMDYDAPGNPLIDIEEPVVRAILDQVPAGRALDVACGTGRYAELLVAAGHEVVGVDDSPAMLARAQVRVPSGMFVEADMAALPFDDASFDLLVCALALAHQPSLAPVFAEFARITRPGAHLVLSDIHWLSLYLGGAMTVPDAAGNPQAVPTSRFLPSDYLTAALGAGLTVRECVEPRWGTLAAGHGGPRAQRWCPAAAAAAYEQTPAAIVWHLQAPS